MSNFSTNINNYSNNELLELISLESNDAINEETITINTDNIISKLKDKKTIDFFNKIKDKLLKLYGRNDDPSSYITDFSTKTEFKNTFLNSNKNTYFNRDIIDKLIIIDSRFRDKYFDESSTNFNITLPQKISNVIDVRLSDIEFPNTWHPFNNDFGNTFFHYRVGEQWQRVDISDGTYYHGNLIDDIKTKISSNMNLEFNLSFDNQGGVANGDGKIKFSLFQETTTINSFDLDFFSDDPDNPIDYNSLTKTDKQKYLLECQKKFGWNLGFRNIDPDYYKNKSSYTSESTLDINGIRYFYLILDDHNQYMNSKFISFSDNMSVIRNSLDIFARISIKGGPFSLYSSSDFSVYSDERVYNGLVNIHKLTVKLVDEYGRVLDLNNNDFSFTIKTKIVQSS